MVIPSLTVEPFVSPANGGWDILWKTYRKTLCTNSISDYLSAGDVKVHLDNLGLKYEEFVVPHAYDITDCFDLNSQPGELMLDFMTEQEHFHRSLTPEIRKGILDLLRSKCSTEKEGKVMFNSNLSCLLVHAWRLLVQTNTKYNLCHVCLHEVT